LKLSNDEVSPLKYYIVWFLLHSQKLVTSNPCIGMPLVYRCKANNLPIELRISVLIHTLTANSFPQSMIARIVPHLLKSGDVITVLHHSL